MYFSLKNSPLLGQASPSAATDSSESAKHQPLPVEAEVLESLLPLYSLSLTYLSFSPPASWLHDCHF